ncbi:MAG: murein L,D-transpeptidase catalytic domain-containing protein, partial [Novosphingobium sp.]
MTFSRRRFIGGIAAGSAGLVAPRAFAMVRNDQCPALLPQAMAALDQHRSSVVQRDVMGLVDFSLPSGLPRFHLVDVLNGRVVMTRLVSHGRGSDPGNSGFVQRFSNVPGSNASSKGAFLTGDTYFGKHGRSRRLIGLDPENNLAFPRAIVIHGASYVDSGMAAAQ